MINTVHKKIEFGQMAVQENRNTDHLDTEIISNLNEDDDNIYKIIKNKMKEDDSFYILRDINLSDRQLKNAYRKANEKLGGF